MALYRSNRATDLETSLTDGGEPRQKRPEFFSYCFFVGLIATTFLV